MITASMLRKQMWMTDDDFDHVVKNSQRVLELNNQYQNHPYVKEFKKECNIMFVCGTYVLQGEEDANFFLVIYGIYSRNIFYKTTQATFAGK